MPRLLDDDDGRHFFGGVRYQALRKGKWKWIEGELAPECWRGGREIEWDFLRIDPKGRKGAIKLPDDQCADHGFTSLFDVSQVGQALAAESRDVTSSHPDLAKAMAALLADMVSKKGQAESFELTPEQERKLKSLGYLR